MIHIDGTWEPGKYLYIREMRVGGIRWIRFYGAVAGTVEYNLLSARLRPTIPDATITEEDAYKLYVASYHQEAYAFSWITREEAQALLEMAIAQNAMRAP